MPFTSYFLRRRYLELASREERRHAERLRRRRTRTLLRRNINPLLDLPDREFVKTFRLNKSEVIELEQTLSPLIAKERRRDGISVLFKILISLAFYATGSYQTLVGQSTLTNVSQTTVSRAVRQVTDALNHPNIHKKYINWPLQTSERTLIKFRFNQKFKIPGVLGCIDGTHVAIIRPRIREERYFNRKGYHSLNVLIICDSDLNILCVDPSTPGSAHDCSVWQSHPLSLHLANGEYGYLLGDSGYPLRKSMMTPILNTVEGTPEHYYYNTQVTARNCVERCIGVLKARFRCLLAARALHYQPSVAAKIINACCVLHNIANRANTEMPQLSPDEIDAERLLQEQISHVLAAEADSISDASRNRRVNVDLLAGRNFQQALVQRLWRERFN